MDMELELIDFLAQLINNKRAIQQGYVASTMWLCTNKELKDECRKEAWETFQKWKERELIAKKNRDNQFES